MKLLLQTDIKKLGYYGDVVEVSDGYARNYLLPQKLAIQPTEANVKAIEQERAHRVELRRLARQELERAAKKVEGAKVTIISRANELGHLFGSVTEEDIASTLREQGFEVQTKQVDLKEHIRSVGDHPVSLRFADNLKATVSVVVMAEDQAKDQDVSAEQPQAEEAADE